LNFRQEETMLRRELISTLPKLFSLSVLGLGTADAQTTEAHKSFNFMIKSAWGSDDPTRVSFPFVHGLALGDAGHQVQIFLTCEATYLMRDVTAQGRVSGRLAAPLRIAREDHG
jgi:hypothetical protein